MKKKIFSRGAGRSRSCINHLRIYDHRNGCRIQVNQTEDEDACDLQDIMESIEDEALRESPAAEITAFAAEIQDTVSGRDLQALAELCDFPISVTMQDGTSLTVNSQEDFITLGKESVFTRVWYMKLELQILPDKQIYGNGIVMGKQE